MHDFFEIDFLDVESAKSGDAITMRYRVNGATQIHVVDAGFQDTGESVVRHIRRHYDNPAIIDRVVATHPDGDHAGGLRTVLESFQVRELWMLRPWLYAELLLPLFTRMGSVESLQRRLREVYPNIAALEEIAVDRRIPIYEPIQGAAIGAFRAMAPTRTRYLLAILNSERTPEAVGQAAPALQGLLGRALAEVVSFVRAGWGYEAFPPRETSAENEMSIVQYANLCGKRILLTADAGRAALAEAADYAPSIGLQLPGIDRFQVPHHGSRRNVSTELLDRWLGPRLDGVLPKGSEKFTAIVSSAKADEHHPRKVVLRALHHRGACVVTTEGKPICSYADAPNRAGWTPVEGVPYPEEIEKD